MNTLLAVYVAIWVLAIARKNYPAPR